MSSLLPWRYRLYKRLPRWAKHIWRYDWVEDDRLTGEQMLAIFNSLEPVMTDEKPLGGSGGFDER